MRIFIIWIYILGILLDYYCLIELKCKDISNMQLIFSRKIKKKLKYPTEPFQMVVEIYIFFISMIFPLQCYYQRNGIQVYLMIRHHSFLRQSNKVQAEDKELTLGAVLQVIYIWLYWPNNLLIPLLICICYLTGLQLKF